MKTLQYQLARQIQSTLEEAFDQIRFSRAAELARSQRYLEAAALLAPGGRLPTSTTNLDMLARIAVGMEDFQTAEKCWQHAAQIEPENPIYREYLHELESVQRQARLRHNVILSLSLAILGALLTLLGFLLWHELRSVASWPALHGVSSTSSTSKPAPAKNPLEHSAGKGNESAAPR